MSDEKRAIWGDPDFEQSVRETAYFLWEQDGKPFGRETDYWYDALECTLRQHTSDKHLSQEPAQQSATGQVDDNQDDLGKPVNEMSK